nr:methionyl-tRNA formyltransferase [Acholeplasmatales bacterium]
MKIIFLGTPEFASKVLEALDSKYEIKLVISQPNREKKKGVLIDTPVASYAKSHNLELLQPEAIKDIYDVIKDVDADTLITAAYGQYIPTKILNLFKTKLNVHASLLPLHRGGAPIQRCLMNGDTKTGVTIMEMEKRLDAGKIYAKEEYIINPD